MNEKKEHVDFSELQSEITNIILNKTNTPFEAIGLLEIIKHKILYCLELPVDEEEQHKKGLKA